MIEMLLVAYYYNGWVVVRTQPETYGVRTYPETTLEIVSGPYRTHEEAIQSVETRAHRIRQGWKP